MPNQHTRMTVDGLGEMTDAEYGAKVEALADVLTEEQTRILALAARMTAASLAASDLVAPAVVNTLRALDTLLRNANVSRNAAAAVANRSDAEIRAARPDRMNPRHAAAYRAEAARRGITTADVVSNFAHEDEIR